MCERIPKAPNTLTPLDWPHKAMTKAQLETLRYRLKRRMTHESRPQRLKELQISSEKAEAFAEIGKG